MSEVLSGPAQISPAGEGTTTSLRQSMVWEDSENKGVRKEDAGQ